jgi:hypothetical protein
MGRVLPFPMSTLRDLPDVLGLNYSLDQIQGAVNDFNDYMNGANAIYDQHFQAFKANAPNMSPDQLAAAGAALEAENASLQQLMSWNNMANNYISSGSGMSGLSGQTSCLQGPRFDMYVRKNKGLSALPVAVWVAIIAVLIGVASLGAYMLAHQKLQNDAAALLVVKMQQQRAAGQQAVLDQQLANGNITPQQWQQMSADLEKQRTTSNADLMTKALTYGGYALGAVLAVQVLTSLIGKKG